MAQNGDYVYHGSSQKLEKLEPRQQMTWDYDKKASVPNGNAAVCAGNVYEPAIFRALVNRHFDLAKSHWSGWSDNGSQIEYRATQTALDGANCEGVVGYVHVFEKQQFEPWRGMEYRASIEVVPELIVEVRAKNLPDNIRVVEPEPR